MSALSIWTIYDHPTDYPHAFVARRHEVQAEGSTPTSDLLMSTDLEAIRTRMRAWGLYCLNRQSGDVPCIIESWL
jgi:hypothetical protein